MVLQYTPNPANQTKKKNIILKITRRSWTNGLTMKHWINAFHENISDNREPVLVQSWNIPLSFT